MRLIRWNQHALLTAVVVVVWLPSQAAGLSEYDGSYAGTIECAQILGHTRGPLKTEFLVKIAGGRVEYERELLRPSGAGITRLGVTERGTGAVSATGEVSLTGRARDQGLSYEATYQGKIDGKHLRLSGLQIWQLPDKANHKRPCTIAVSRSE